MIHIGICDDIDRERQHIYDICEEYFKEIKDEHEYTFFQKSEDVLAYCDSGNKRIDLLFLDIELPGLSGIELKDAILTENTIWRIAFVSSHEESILGAFSKKTIGFICKPADKDKVIKMIKIVMDELNENVVLSIRDLNGNAYNIEVKDIIYMKAAGSYTEIVTFSSVNQMNRYILSTRKIGDLQKEMKEHSIIRVHKSYMVNLLHVLEIGQNVVLYNGLIELPVGRVYKEAARKKYLEFGRTIMRNRI